MKIPKTIGRYEVADLISQGGMGTLFRARDPRIGRYVAVKVLKKDFDNAELRDRFSREARAAGCLSHPNIVTIYDVGEDDGLPFIAMEYVRGETFVDVIARRQPLPVERKLQMIEEVCAGLTHAHEAGIVHRDIKPANLILSAEGVVKILDFGIAKLSSAGLTMPGIIMGTLNYMSPEQAKGRPVDARTDVFAVGGVLYELLAYQPAFAGTRAGEVLQRILSGTPTPITQICPDLDPRIVQVIDRSLEKDPANRYPTSAALQKAIAAVRMDSGGAVAQAGRPTRQTRSSSSWQADPAMARAEQIEDFFAAADRAFAAGDYDGATEGCKQVLLLDASNERAFAELARIHAAIDERQAAVQSAVERGRAAFESGNLMSALREVKQALALDAYDADALSLSADTEQAIRDRQEDARIRAAVDSARRRFSTGDHQAALAALEALQPGSNAIVRTTLDELRAALARIDAQQRVDAELEDRRRRIASLAGDARAAIASSRFDDALRIAAEIQDIDPAAPDIADLRARASDAQAAARAREEVGRLLAEFDTRLADSNLGGAEELADAAAALAPTDSRLPAARQRLADAKAAVAAAEARSRQGEEALDAAAARLQAGDLAGADDLLKRAADLVPGHARAADLAERLRTAREQQAAAEEAERIAREVERMIESARRHLAAAANDPNELPIALGRVNRALEFDPTNAEAAQVKAAIEADFTAKREATRARSAIDNAGRRFALGKHQAAIKLLEDFEPQANPDIQKALTDLRTALQVIEENRRAEQERLERQRRLAALVAEARTAIGDQRFDAALELVSQAEHIDAAAADLAPLKDQILREQAAAGLAAEIAALVAQIDDRLSRGELDAARELLATATARNGADPAVAGAARRVEQAAAERADRAAHEREQAATDEREAAAHEREGAAAREREAAAAREREAAAARERDAALAREREKPARRVPPITVDHNSETIIFGGDLREAVRAARASLETPPAASGAAERATGGDTDAQSPRTRADNLLAAARAQLRADASVADVTSAVEKIARALALVPNDADAMALDTTANETLLRLRDAARIDAAIRNARSRFNIGKHQAAIQLLEDLDPASHPQVADALRELKASLRDIEEKRRHKEAAAVDRPRPAADDGATLFAPAQKPVMPDAPPPAEPVVAGATPSADGENSQRRLILLAGVLVAALIVALLLLRFAS